VLTAGAALLFKLKPLPKTTALKIVVITSEY